MVVATAVVYLQNDKRGWIHAEKRGKCENVCDVYMINYLFKKK